MQKAALVAGCVSGKGRFWCSLKKVRLVVVVLAWIIVGSLVGGIVFGSLRHVLGGVLRIFGFFLLGICLMACLIVWFSSTSIHL